jgi:precorrin-6B C5,15-methyltransferase / cobalt-precorrin-6B C5,C15-methyltransferase
MSSAKILIVGIGDEGPEGLTRQARELMENAAYLVGPQSLVEGLKTLSGKKLAVSNDLDELETTLRKLTQGPIVLVASGDPLFYGTARYLMESIGKDRFEVVPHVSSMQLAFARIKESWDEAYLTNLANQPLDRVVDRIRTAQRVGLFTTEEITPAVVAEALQDRRIDYFTAYVCENLGSPDERVTQGDLGSIAKQSFAPLNVMVLVRREGTADRPSGQKGKRLFGNPDDAFLQSRPKRGLLTTSEVRCIALSEMDLGPTSIVWDVGAGSGSLAIEAAQIAHGGQVYAIEMDVEDYNLIVENATQFDCPGLTPIHGQAPEAWQNLPDPDAVFVGGTGRSVGQLAQAAWDRLRSGGRLLVNVASPESLVTIQSMLTEYHVEPKISMVNIARGNYQLERMRFEAINPTFLILAKKP